MLNSFLKLYQILQIIAILILDINLYLNPQFLFAQQICVSEYKINKQIIAERVGEVMRAFYYDGVCIQNRRKTNMDSVLLKERSISGTEVCLAAVCDGVGSLESGAVASSLAIQTLVDWLNQISTVEQIGFRLLETVYEINRRIVQESSENGIRTASTFSALLMAEGRYYTAHVGDSRIYCYSESRLQQLTEDQVINGRLAGYLGRPEKLPVLYGEGEYAGKKFLLCSDGLYKKLDSENLSKYCAKVDKKNISRILDKLVQAAVNNGEMDNISAAFVVCER